MRIVLIEKTLDNKDLLNLSDTLKKANLVTEIVFFSNDLIIFRGENTFIKKANHRKAYDVKTQRIIAISCMALPQKEFLYLRNKIHSLDISNYYPKFDGIPYRFINLLGHDRVLKSFQPNEFYEQHEKEIINLIFSSHITLKKSVKEFLSYDLNNMRDSIIKEIFKNYSNVYKFYRKQINTQIIEDEIVKKAKQMRLLNLNKNGKQQVA